MKNKRQSVLLELIKNNNFNRQEELLEQLIERGFNVTQATVSRDLRSLGITKSEGSSGFYKYREVAVTTAQDGKNSAILRQTVFSVSTAYNQIVIKTYSGMGSAAGAAFDAFEFDGVLGSLAGDDTLLVITKDFESAETVAEQLNNTIG